jgi:acetyl esterase/lipase
MLTASKFAKRLTGCLLAMTAGAAMGAETPATQPASESGGKVVRLWQGDAPEAQGKEESDKPTNDVPTLTIYPPAEGKNNGAALVVCPGGGYGHLAAHEGRPVAEWFASLGGTGLVLKYRLGPKYHHPAEMDDVQRAIRLTRANASEWGIDPTRIGVLGFSAGGHLASTAATHFDSGEASASDPVEKVSCRPDIAVLVYPVISLHPPYGHGGSRKNLLGDDPDDHLVDLLSNEKEVTEKTPPTFLVHSSDDHTVPVENSLEFATALAQHKVPFEMRIFGHGGHGFGMAPNDPELSTWPKDVEQWLTKRDFFKPMVTK